jgi:hypothetical protein
MDGDSSTVRQPACFKMRMQRRRKGNDGLDVSTGWLGMMWPTRYVCTVLVAEARGLAYALRWRESSYAMLRCGSEEAGKKHQRQHGRPGTFGYILRLPFCTPLSLRQPHFRRYPSWACPPTRARPAYRERLLARRRWRRRGGVHAATCYGSSQQNSSPTFSLRRQWAIVIL